MDFHVSFTNRFDLASTSKGNQINWFKDNIYLKVDTLGYEGFAEALVSELLQFVISDYEFIDYYMCNIIEDSEVDTRVYSGCFSYNYLKNSESFISIYKILKMVDKRVETRLKNLKGKDLVNYVVKSVKDVTGIDCTDYLGYTIKLDAITLNEDRHLNNINLVYNSKVNTFRLAPIFDNGLSLLSDTHCYLMKGNTFKYMESVKSKPFSVNFSKQLSYFNTDLLKIDYYRFLDSLEENKELFIYKEHKRAKDVILYRLKRMEGVLWQRF